ncbi:acetylornithine transaminase [Pullulanibacillus sp. KACC 23026]|uniref:acetylornithine transaminase n=1 Tax=Pullulanibacillus sp. KACC 23026 TaxID=3028315 RepID=UPI0023AF6661|nr:acetylornithine transaminase [Pullulanibacillus sp. KACC 23026]WEG13066.1 acetylornithine transaminase [Pullulanibacillus sp. KACC 23026]
MSSETTTINPLMATYNRFPLTLVKGKGSHVWDDKGEQYLDFTSGIATCNLGHVPETVKNALQEQLNNLWHISNLYHIPSQEALAKKLTDVSCFDQVFFCNSGAEANEGAIKLARRYAQKVKKTDAYEVVTFTQSFHGRTLGTLSATGQPKIQDGFYPLLNGFRYLPYNDVDALKDLKGDKTCAVLLELVQGEGGVIPADADWIQALKQTCEDEGLLFMVDEIQTGVGRTGTLFAYEQYGIEPDVMTLAKGLGNGIPIGAVLAKAEVAQAFGPGSHGSTFGGNPMATTSGVTVLKEMTETDVLAHSQIISELLFAGLNELKDKYPDQFLDVRGRGLLVGVQTACPAIDIVNKARDKKLLVLVAGANVLRILPPLTATAEDVQTFLSIMEEILNEG